MENYINYPINNSFYEIAINFFETLNSMEMIKIKLNGKLSSILELIIIKLKSLPKEFDLELANNKLIMEIEKLEEFQDYHFGLRN